MPDPLNPYAPPKSSLDPASEEGVWRDGKILVLRPGSALPPRCVKCNEAAKLPTKPRKVYWHQPWIYILVLLNLIIYAIVALIVRKQATIAPGLCPVHRKRRWLGFGVGWGGVLLGFFAMIAGGVTDHGWIIIPGLILLFGGIVAGIILTRIVMPERIDKDFVRLKGCGQAFLDSLPEFHG